LFDIWKYNQLGQLFGFFKNPQTTENKTSQHDRPLTTNGRIPSSLKIPPLPRPMAV
jgi:hypothetical protein